MSCTFCCHILQITTLCVAYVLLVMDQSSQIKEQRNRKKEISNLKIHTTLPLQPFSSYLDALLKNSMFKDDCSKSDLRLHLLFVLYPLLLFAFPSNVRLIVHGRIWLLYLVEYSFLWILVTYSTNFCLMQSNIWTQIKLIINEALYFDNDKRI